MLPSDLEKQREITFSATPPYQMQQAFLLLDGMEGLSVYISVRPRTLSVRYHVNNYTLEGLENGLIAQGFHLDNSILSKLKRSIAYYCERIQRENLVQPERTEKIREAFVQAWEHHPHGDYDATPEELRTYR